MSATTGGASPVAVRSGRLLARNRMAAGHGQEEFARLVGKHRVEISLLERGQQVPRLDTVIRIACGLEIEPEELFEGIRWHPGVDAAGGEERADPRQFAAEVRRRLARNLNGLRRRSGRSREQLARLAGLHSATVLSYEMGVTMPQISSVLRLAGAMGAAEDDLFAGIRWSARMDVIGQGAFRTVGEAALTAEIAALRETLPRRRRGRGG